MTVISARGIRFSYDESRPPALRGVDLDVAAGEVVLLRGPSGGGKTTLLRALGGLLPHFHGGAFGGEITVAGLDGRRSRPAEVSLRAPLLFQDVEAHAVMSDVERDVAFGAENAGVAPGEIRERVGGALAAVDAKHLAGRRIDELSGGERQRVALAGVLALEPQALLLDEPTSQLDDRSAARNLELVRRLAGERGLAVVISAHRVDRVEAIASRVVEIRDGRIGRGLDRDQGLPELARARRLGPEALRLSTVTIAHGERVVAERVHLALHAGSVLALSGPNGAGKSTLLRAIAGLHPVRAGSVRIEGREVAAAPPEDRVPALGYVGQDPGRHLLTESVRAEVELAPRYQSLPRRTRQDRVAWALSALGIDELADHHPLDLSTGQRQRVAIAAAISGRPRLLLLDEPTRGLDSDGRRRLGALLRALAADGMAAIVATHDSGVAGLAADRWARLGGGRLTEQRGANRSPA